MRKAPAFWSPAGRHHPFAWLLAPLGWLYGAVVARKLARHTSAVSQVPVICVGNATMGGVGKTPFVAMLAQRLVGMGHRPIVLMRGYGGTEPGPHLVTKEDDAVRVGDEALLLARDCRVIVSRDRPAGAVLAMQEGASVIVMDDGFQNPSLSKSFSFLLIDGDTGFGNGRIFPAGPLRESVSAAIARADAIVVVGGDNAVRPPNVPDLPQDRLLRMRIGTDVTGIPPGQPLFAFAGIGRPEKFFTGLARTGRAILGTRGFPDHYPYRPEDIDGLRNEADRAGALLVTTEKDYCRLPIAARAHIHPCPATVVLDAPDGLDDLLGAAI